MKTQSLSVLPLLVLLVVGCGPSEPTPIPPPRTLARTHVPTAEMERMVDRAAQDLAETLPNLPAVKSAQNKQVLALGPLRNKTTTADAEFESAVRSLYGKLQSNRAMTDSFAFVTTSDAEARELIDRDSDAVGFDDPLDASKQQQGRPARYNPNAIYVVTGNYYQARSNSGDQVDYHLFLQVEHVASRRMVASKEFQATLIWNPSIGTWESGH